MMEILEQCFHTLELYGKEASAFGIVVLTFERFLADYPAAKIVPSFEKYMRERTRFPAPADIIGIIEERIKIDSGYYRQLLEKRKAYTFLAGKEKTYCEKYEQQTLNDWS